MKILVCPDSFKESLSSSCAGTHIQAGIRKVLPSAACKIIPMADGGEGTVDVLLSSLGGRYVEVTVHDPLMRPVIAKYGILSDNVTAVVEMAAASGLPLLDKHERDPLATNSFGTGELIQSALDHGCKKIVLGMGGSATIDAGIGMAQALGFVFMDHQGNAAGTGGNNLGRITDIEFSGTDPRLKDCTIIAACDVNNPLTGRNGAAYVYGPQKGATPEMVRLLDDNLRHFSGIIRKSLDIDVENAAGTGAAGGLGAGLMAFLNARLEPGFNLVSRMVELERWIQWADLIITGEGRMDAQTCFGKVPSGIAHAAGILKKPVIAFTGIVDKNWYDSTHPEFIAVIPIADQPLTMKQSIQHASILLERSAERTMQVLHLGLRM
ncbi:MAG: glycerate kinase [Bacteroidales bacterium]|nr:glycerate kinase [Bacteroidales bacterium]